MTIKSHLTLFCLVLTVSAVLLVNSATAQNTKCGANQEWTTCGTACPESCNQPEAPQICTYQCVIGCQCKSGYVLNSSGACVERSQC